MQLTQEIKTSIPYQYAEDVLSGKIVCGKYVKLAAQRFFNWIDNADQDGFYLDHASGMEIINFFRVTLNHTKGRSAGQPFILAPFQQFTMYNVFAWKNVKGLRRINTVYDKRAKKNGKSAEMAGLALFAMSLDNESEAEVYVGATKEEQAKIVWQQARSFIESASANPILAKLGFRCKQKEIWFGPTGSVMRPLGGDSKTQDGINAHLSIIDEYHAHSDDTVKENLESSSVQRSQPITWHITTAGFNAHGVCKHYEDVCKEVLEEKKRDDHLWIMIHDLDNDDDWEDEKNWVKANPLLGNGMSISGIRKEYTKAINQPSKVPNFKTKHLNMWVDAPEVRISSKIWTKGNQPIQLQNFLRYGCAGGLDLSSTTDLSAYVVISNPDEDGYRDLLPFLFCPADTIDERAKEDRVPYRFWKDDNLSDRIDFTGIDKTDFWLNLKSLIATPGNQIDYDVIQDYMIKMHTELRPTIINFDRYGSTEITQPLMDSGIQVNPFSQTMSYYSTPTKEFERLAYMGKLRHGGHPVLRWMISGCVAIQDTNENIRYSKKHSTKRIDGIIATIMALAGSMMEADEKSAKQSKYNNDNQEIVM